MSKSMEQIVSLCKRRGFIFPSSEIYGGLNGFWDYGPLGTALKRNVRDAWYDEMVTRHDETTAPEDAPSTFQMVGLESSIIMHPQVWKCSGHYDLFHDMMVDCKACKARFRADHLIVKIAFGKTKTQDKTQDRDKRQDGHGRFPVLAWSCLPGSANFEWPGTGDVRLRRDAEPILKRENLQTVLEIESYPFDRFRKQLDSSDTDPTQLPVHCPNPACRGELTEPREFNLMFESHTGAVKDESNKVFLRPETAQGMFVNFRNVTDSSRVKVPFGIAQIGKSFRNEITPRNFTFRTREFEQMEMEFFCPPSQSKEWYEFWRNRRFAWYVNLGITSDNLQLRDHDPEELSHYSVGTADVEYAFPFLEAGEYGELEGIAHRGDFDLRSHMEGKLVHEGDELVVEQDAEGNPKYRGSGKDLTYFDDQSRERYVPHVIEPAAGADRATLAFLCEAYTEDEQPDDKGQMKKRTVMRFHPRLAPIKAAVFPLIKKLGMPETATAIYRELKAAGIVCAYDQQGAIGRRYRRQDEIGTPFCITVDGETADANTVTVRDRDTLEQVRVPIDEIVEHIRARIDS